MHEALEELEQAEPRLAQVAQMRYFGGYSEQEIADTLDSHRTHGAARLGEGTADPRRDAALSRTAGGGRPAPEEPMKLTIPQMALMSRLLDEALPLDEAARRRWLVDLAPEFQDLAAALRAHCCRTRRAGADFQSLLETAD